MHQTNPAEILREADTGTSERLLCLDDVCRLTCLGKTFITGASRERLQKGTGDFPLPVKIGMATRWLYSEIEAWMRSRPRLADTRFGPRPKRAA